MTEAAAIVCLCSILLIPLAMAGMALLHRGMGRHTAAVIAISALVFVAVGFSLAGYRGGAGYGFFIQGRTWEWLGNMPLFMRGLRPGLNPTPLTALLGLMSVAFTAFIPARSAADRCKLSAMCLSTVFLAGWTYPVFAHWAWAGWLDALGRNFAMGVGFLDAGGAGAIQVTGGLTALSLTLILGPPSGKVAQDRRHHPVFVLFGSLLAWVGWIGLDNAGAMLYTGTDSSKVVLIAVNATLGAASSALAAAALTRLRFGKLDTSLCANGWIAGLVSTSAGCAAIAPAGAIIIGLLAGVLVIYTMEWLERHMGIDDPSASISVHAVAGLWGLLATGWFARLGDARTEGSQWMAQLTGIATLLGFVLPGTYAMHWALNRFRSMRGLP